MCPYCPKGYLSTSRLCIIKTASLWYANAATWQEYDCHTVPGDRPVSRVWDKVCHWMVSPSVWLASPNIGWEMHICVSKQTIIGSDNGLSPYRRQAIIVSLSAPSHYLNQCWYIVNWTLRNKLQWNFNRNSNIFFQKNALENVVCLIASISSRPQWVKGFLTCPSTG